MKYRFRLCLIVATLALGIMFFAPAIVAQQQPVSPPPSEVTPPQTPSETPTTTDSNQIKQNQNDSNTPPPTAVLPETSARDNRGMSWGSLILGLVLGGIIGYLIGRQPYASNTVRRDRAA